MAENLFDILNQVTSGQVYRFSRGEGLRHASRVFREYSRTNVNPDTGIPGGQNPKLLTESSSKIEHNLTSGVPEVLGVRQAVQYLAPAGSSGVCNTCGSETKGCRGVCLHGSGRMGMFPQVGWATHVRTQFAAEHPDLYLGVWHGAMRRHREKALKGGLIPVVRHGGTSDVPMDLLQSSDILVGEHPDVMWNEYTKHGTRKVSDVRMSSQFPNYYFVHSAHELMPMDVMEHITKQGGNIAIPYSKTTGFDPNKVESVTLRGNLPQDIGRSITLPVTKSRVGRGRTSTLVSSGELHDVRFLDPGIGGAVMLPEKVLTSPEKRGFVDPTNFVREFTPEGQQVVKGTPVTIGRKTHFTTGTGM